LRAPGNNKVRRIAPSVVSARLSGRVSLEAQADGSILACFDGVSVPLGKFSADAAKRAQSLRTGLPLGSFASGGNPIDREIDRLVRRLGRSGLLEYRLGQPRDGKDKVIIEPQIADYWPRMPELANGETIVLSRFAYLRRRGDALVLESPRAGALFRICDPAIATALANLATPQKISRLRRQDGFPGIALLSLLLDSQILFRIDATSRDGLRAAEGDDNLVLWDFHDLLFHTHSTEGRHANPLGGLYLYAALMPPPPAVRPCWPGKKIDLPTSPALPSATMSPLTKLLSERHSTRDFDDRQPITLAALSHFLERTARVRSNWKSRLDLDVTSPEVAYTARPYPSGGSAYELELYLTVDKCEGLARGFYHYDADRHALVPIKARPEELEAMLAGAKLAMGTSAAPQILITIAARFDRVAWKYSAIAYSLILKDVGVLLQTLYLVATDLGLAGCAIGTSNIDLFEKMTGIHFHIEGPVGQFALGRGGEAKVSG
jgi:SagB-type dehydrogenase family enzyme